MIDSLHNSGQTFLTWRGGALPRSLIYQCPLMTSRYFKFNAIWSNFWSIIHFGDLYQILLFLRKTKSKSYVNNDWSSIDPYLNQLKLTENQTKSMGLLYDIKSIWVLLFILLLFVLLLLIQQLHMVYLRSYFSRSLFIFKVWCWHSFVQEIKQSINLMAQFYALYNIL
jgi:hypothetical protein